MLLTIALACFAIQVVAWLVLPASASSEVPSEVFETEGTDAYAA